MSEQSKSLLGVNGSNAERRIPPGAGRDAVRFDSSILRNRARQAGPARPVAGLASVIEGEVIPRLLLAHCGGLAPSAAELDAEPAPAPSSRDVDQLISHILEGDMVTAMSLIFTLRERGVTAESVYLDLFGPAAQRVGDLWKEDACDFTAVTMGLCVLHRLLRRIASEHEWPRETEHGRSILLAPVAGEQHTFGLVIIAELFRRAGWRVRQEMPTSPEQLGHLVGEEHFDVIGLSASREEQINDLSTAIGAARSQSRHKEMRLVVGGAIFAERPELGERLGADAVAEHGAAAVSTAERLVDLSAGR